MPALKNPRHEAFCRAIVAQLGGKWASQGAAYVAAGYNAKGAGEAGGSAEAAASRLLKRVQSISARISELQEQAARRKKVTVDTIVEEMEEAREVAREERQASAMVAASAGKAKVLGLVVDKSETGKPGDFSGAQSQKDVAVALLRNAGLREEEVSEGVCCEALAALAHFNDRIAAIVASTTEPHSKQ